MLLPFLLPVLTFAAPVGRADAAVAALGEAAGVAMRAEGAVASEIVFLRIDGRPLGEVTAALARVTNAEWAHESDGSLVLRRPPGREAQEARRETDRRLAALEAWRSGLVRSLDAPFGAADLSRMVRERAGLEGDDEGLPDGERERRWSRKAELDRRDPVYRALARCLRGLDLRPIAALEPQAAVVFATSPNAAQRPLPTSVQEALRALVPEQALWGRALRAMPRHEDDGRFRTDETIRFFDGQPAFAARTEPWQRTLPFDAAPDAAQVRATCNQEDGYTLTLWMSAREHPLVEFEVGDLSTYPHLPDDERPKTGLKSPAPGAATQALFARVAGDRKALAALRPYFDDPVGHDFLRLGNQELLEGLAAQRHRSVVACLPDAMGRVFSETLDLDALAGGDDGWTVAESPGLIEIRPRRWTVHWRERADRTRMAACVQGFRRQGRIDAMDFYRLVAGAGDDRSPACVFVQLVDPAFAPLRASFGLPFQSAFLPLLTGLSEGQIARLRRGETIPYRELGAAQRVLAARIVYGTRTNTEGEGTPLDEDATRELPNGLLGGSGLSARFDEERLAVFHNGRGEGRDEFFVENLSEDRPMRFWSGPPPDLPEGGMANATVDLRLRRRILLRCGLAPGHWTVGRFTEPMPPTTTRPVPLAQVPPEFRKRIEETARFLDGFRLGPGEGPPGGP